VDQAVAARQVGDYRFGVTATRRHAPDAAAAFERHARADVEDIRPRLKRQSKWRDERPAVALGRSVIVHGVDSAAARPVFEHRRVQPTVIAVCDLDWLTGEAPDVLDVEAVGHANPAQEAVDIILAREIFA